MTANDLLPIQDTAVREAREASDLAALEAVRIRYLGRKGMLQDIMAELKNVAPEEKRAFGQGANLLKNAIQEALDARKVDLEAARDAQAAKGFDVTLPGAWRTPGAMHPVSKIMDLVRDVFGAIGFTVADGPDVETVFNNFDALNTPADHPSRDPQDTFYLADGTLLRTQTSPIQIRHMMSTKPPVRIIAPGRAYRRDTPDATHSANFHQIEGLFVDRKVSMADLKGDLTHFARSILGPRTKIRFRPHFFPFTEPSVEVDFTCHVCSGKGCRVCKQSGWIEIAGAGMVDPNVFRAVGYDPAEVTGYAFGMGIERIAMILYGIEDIRHIYENDIRFLRQF